MMDFFRDPTVWILAGALISAIAAWRASKIQSDESNKLSKKLIESQAEVIKLTQKINDYVTGGESFCYIDMVYFNSYTDILATIKHSGKYPIHNVEISLINTDEEYEALDGDKPIPTDLNEALSWVKPKDLTEKYNSKDPFYLEIRNISKGESFTIPGIQLGKNRKQKSFNIRFKSDNRIWYERILLRQFGAFPKKIFSAELDKRTGNLKKEHYYQDDHAISAIQVYTIEEIQGEADKQKSKPYEKILIEGTTRSINYYDYFGDAEFFQKVKWDGFPLRNEETKPFTSKGFIHWNSAVLNITKGEVERMTFRAAEDKDYFKIIIIRP